MYGIPNSETEKVRLRNCIDAETAQNTPSLDNRHLPKMHSTSRLTGDTSEALLQVRHGQRGLSLALSAGASGEDETRNLGGTDRQGDPGLKGILLG